MKLFKDQVKLFYTLPQPQSFKDMEVKSFKDRVRLFKTLVPQPKSVKDQEVKLIKDQVKLFMTRMRIMSQKKKRRKNMKVLVEIREENKGGEKEKTVE